MISKSGKWLNSFVVLLFIPAADTRNNASLETSQKQDPAAISSDAQQNNLTEFSEMLRSNLRKETTQILGAVMQLEPNDAAKFWPFYAEYDTEVTKINDRRVFCCFISGVRAILTQKRLEKFGEPVTRLRSVKRRRGACRANSGTACTQQTK